ncbi:hypothetical protein EV359DRAFT_66381 [Lentinula novae-zelandiae]|nr:hypothetical protein EV359DRAFT_66381 [Lentinula novae-zelandiae]
MPNVQRFPMGLALKGEDNWWPYKREISLTVESKGLQGQTPSPEEWYTRDRYVASTIVLNIMDPTGLGVDYTKTASIIWEELVKQFKQKSEELLLFHNSNLRAHRYAYPKETMEEHKRTMRNLLRKATNAETMEEHKRTMRNLLRKATNAGAVITDGQFCIIILASLPKDWDADIRHLPGKTSSEAFIHLQGIWLQKAKRQMEEEQEEKKQAHRPQTRAGRPAQTSTAGRLATPSKSAGQREGAQRGSEVQ